MLVQIRPVIPDAPIGEAARGQRPISGARLSGIGLVAATRNSGMLGRHPVARNIVYGEKAGAFFEGGRDLG